ncbi:MAG: 30S ribosomal protein S6 [Planctomycetota bacterium]
MAGKTSVYEGLFILDANRFSRDRGAISKGVESLVEQSGGEVLVSRLWEERRMAYPIRGQRKGAYWLMYFRLQNEKVAELTRQCEIHDSILRQLFVRLPTSLVDPILAHAKGENVETPEEAETAESEAVVAATE